MDAFFYIINAITDNFIIDNTKILELMIVFKKLFFANTI